MNSLGLIIPVEKIKSKRGRPALPDGEKKVRVTYRIQPWIAEALRELEGVQSHLVERALIKTYKLRKPK